VEHLEPYSRRTGVRQRGPEIRLAFQPDGAIGREVNYDFPAETEQAAHLHAVLARRHVNMEDSPIAKAADTVAVNPDGKPHVPLAHFIDPLNVDMCAAWLYFHARQTALYDANLRARIGSYECV
jgi:hypothetical protein